MADQVEGKAGVVREMVAGAAAELEDAKRAAAGEQLPIFPSPLTSDRARREQGEYAKRLASGRPKGAQNLSTREFRAWLLARGVSPLVSLMHYATMSPVALARELGCKPIDAFREWRILQVELAPYLHSRLAFVDDKGEAIPLLQMIVAGQLVAPGAAPGAVQTPWAMREAIARGGLAAIEQNQPVSAPAPAVSQNGVSDGGVK